MRIHSDFFLDMTIEVKITSSFQVLCYGAGTYGTYPVPLWYLSGTPSGLSCSKCNKISVELHKLVLFQETLAKNCVELVSLYFLKCFDPLTNFFVCTYEKLL